MRSRFADAFNHDADAPDYDGDVGDETHPLRAGYAAALDWVAQTARIESHHTVLELGAGTGNLTTLLGPARQIVAVDISLQMLALAQRKVVGGVTWMNDDLLAFFDKSCASFDRIVSTYAIHHLVDDEKTVLFHHIKDRLTPGGRTVFGDLMFESTAAMRHARRVYRDSAADVADAIDTEFFWVIDKSVRELERLGFDVATRRFSDLSWGICATL